MKISIVIPVYNVEKYVRQCIDSVINQHYKDIEIIIVNDGSTDSSKEICEEYELKHTCLKLIDKKNGGLSDARNVGILNATGEYVLFLDADDYWENEHFLLEIVQYIKKNPNIDYVFFRYKYFYQKKNKYIEAIFDIDEKEIVGKSGIECLDYILSEIKNFQWFACMGIIRRAFLLENNLFFVKGRNYEDMLWTPKIFLKGKTIGFYNKPVYIYRLERDGQITSHVSYKNLDDNVFVATKWFEALKEYPIGDDLKKKLFININMRYFYAIKFAGFLTSPERRRMIHQLKQHKHLLLYADGENKVIKVLCNTIGFCLTVTLLHVAVHIKNTALFFLNKRT